MKETGDEKSRGIVPLKFVLLTARGIFAKVHAFRDM
jgi:hypothetical protein